MTIPLLEIPDDFEAHITESEINDLDERDRKTALRLSKVAQWSDFMLGEIVLQNQQLRQLEAEQIKRKRQEWGTIKWIISTLVSGLILTLLKMAFKI